MRVLYRMARGMPLLLLPAAPAAILLYALAMEATEDQGPGDTTGWDGLGWVVMIGYPALWFAALGSYLAVPRSERHGLRASRWCLAWGAAAPLAALLVWALFMWWVLSGRA